MHDSKVVVSKRQQRVVCLRRTGAPNITVVCIGRENPRQKTESCRGGETSFYISTTTMNYVSDCMSSLSEKTPDTPSYFLFTVYTSYSPYSVIIPQTGTGTTYSTLKSQVHHLRSMNFSAKEISTLLAIPFSSVYRFMKENPAEYSFERAETRTSGKQWLLTRDDVQVCSSS